MRRQMKKQEVSLKHFGKTSWSGAECLVSGIAFCMVICLLLLTKAFSLQARAAVLPPAPQCRITYDFGKGKTYTVTPELAMTMMVTNKDGSYYIDPKTGYYVCDSNKMQSFFSGLQNL